MTEYSIAPVMRLPPFLSALFRPRQIIQQIAGSTSLPTFFALCGGAVAGSILPDIIKASVGWEDLKAILILIVGVTILMAVGLCVASAAARRVARMLGGRTEKNAMRNALAWGNLPLGWAAVIMVVILVFRVQTGYNVPGYIGGTISIVAGVWSILLGTMMVMAVGGFGVVRAVVTYMVAWLTALVFVALPFRIFVWQPFNMLSNGQSPTILKGDYLFVSKYAYGYSRFSFPFSPPLFQGRIVSRQPKRGDTVVFKLPRDNKTDYIKRVIGLPGDEIQVRSGMVYINGSAVPRRRIDDFPSSVNGVVSRVPQYEETLPNGVTYRVLDADPSGIYDNTELFKVPAGHYFVMGDHRDNSMDSRAKFNVGYVPFENLVGRVEIIFASISEGGGRRAGRMLTWVR